MDHEMWRIDKGRLVIEGCALGYVAVTVIDPEKTDTPGYMFRGWAPKEMKDLDQIESLQALIFLAYGRIARLAEENGYDPREFGAPNTIPTVHSLEEQVMTWRKEYERVFREKVKIENVYKELRDDIEEKINDQSILIDELNETFKRLSGAK